MLPEFNHFPEQQAHFVIPGAAGRIEVITDAPKAAAINTTAIICHPHPLMSGTMHNKVVSTVARGAKESGLHTVRFNFRGVGESDGEHTQGIGETDDLVTLVNWVQRQRPHDKICLVGFSFGAYVAFRAANLLPLALLVCIAPPVHYPEFSVLATPTCPWYVIQGDEDEVVNPEQVVLWAQQHTPAPTIIQMQKAGHFFHGQLIPLKQELLQIFSTLFF